MLAVFLAVLLVTGAGAEITIVVPNPRAPHDKGEYLVISFPTPTNTTGWAITDGESTASFPNRTITGEVAVTVHPAAVRNTTELPVVPLRGWLALANDGERIHLLRDGTPADTVTYDVAPEGEQYIRTDTGWAWTRLGATDYAPAEARGGSVRLFVLPDSPDTPIDALRTAEDRILLAGYTFSSRRVTTALCTARQRGVTVHVLLERAPVGGITRREASLLDDLVACNVPVVVIGGEHARYAFHHAKYAVIDDRALVLTENWNPSGTGGRSSRGWGVVVHDPNIAATLSDLFAADAKWRAAENWTDARTTITPIAADPPPPRTYPPRFPDQHRRVDRVTVLIGPDNAEPEMINLLDRANDSIRIQQVTIGSRNHPFLQAAIHAAERGVTVQVLLSSAWYVRDDNTALITWLRERAARDGLPIEARLVDPRGRFEKTHVKGVIVDDQHVAIGSMNWNNHSARQNRETVVVLTGDAVGEYYAEVYRADWRGGAWTLPIGLLGATGAVLLVGTIFGRRSIVFE